MSWTARIVSPSEFDHHFDARGDYSFVQTAKILNVNIVSFIFYDVFFTSKKLTFKDVSNLDIFHARCDHMQRLKSTALVAPGHFRWGKLFDLAAVEHIVR